MSLIISATPQNNASVNTPVFLDWSPANNVMAFYFSPALSSFIGTQLAVINVKDVIGNPDFSQYDSFRIGVNRHYATTPPAAWIVFNPLLAADGYTSSPINSGPIQLINNDTVFQFQIDLQNLALLPISASPYEYWFTFNIQGRDPTSTFYGWEQVSSYTFKIKLFVTNALVFSSPSALNFVHYQGTTLPTQTIHLDGQDWSLLGSENFVLSSITPGVTITTTVNPPASGGTFMTASGNGPADIDVTLGSFYDVGLIDPSQLTKDFLVAQGVTSVSIIKINVTVYNQATLNLSPGAISFYAVKEIQEPDAVHMLYDSADPAYIITASPWLTWLEEIIEVSPNIMKPVLTIKPIATANMSVGLYTGFVKIEATIAGVLTQRMAAVTYNLQGFIHSPYPQGLPAFTLDTKYFDFFSNNVDTYFQLTATVNVFDFFTFAQTAEIINEKLPLFNGKATLNYGQVIHRLMKKFNSINQEEYQYQMAHFSLFAQEIAIATKAVIRSATLPNISFIAGLSNGITTTGFLEYNAKASRVTTNSFYILNILIPGIGYEVRIFKNGTPNGAFPLNYLDETIISKKVDFSNYRQGDYIEYSLNRSTDSRSTKTIVKAFNVLPADNYSCHVTWENEYLLQSILECTGGIAIKSDFENRSSLLYQNLVEVLEIITNTKVNKLTINTGWLTRNDVDTVESLFRAKRVWIELPSKTVSLRPMNKTMVNQDTSRELIDYSIEFQINRTYNEETYSL